MSYLECYIPKSTGIRTKQKTLRWSGINLKETIDSGELTVCENMRTDKSGVLRTVAIPVEYDNNRIDECIESALDCEPSQIVERKINSVFAFENIIIIILLTEINKGAGPFYYVCVIHDTTDGTSVGKWPINQAVYKSNVPRSVTRFNIYDGVGSEGFNIITATYTRKLLIFPDAYSMDFDQSSETFNPSYLGNNIPKLTYVTSYGGRLWGVKDGKIYASAYNNYADWNLDTATDISAAHAWVTATQTNTEADTEFTGITVIDGHVIAFKRNMMYQIYNTKNPFRAAEISNKGAVNNFAHCVYDNVLYYVADDGIYAYSGGYPEKISEKIDVSYVHFDSASTICAYDGVLYFYSPHNEGIYTYCIENGTWASQSMTYNAGQQNEFNLGHPNCMTGTKYGVFVSSYDDDDAYKIYILESKSSQDFSEFKIESDMKYGSDLSEKAIRKIRLSVSFSRFNQGAGDEDIDEAIINIQFAGITKSYNLYLHEGEQAKEEILTFIVTKSSAFSHQIRISGKGCVQIAYMTIEYEESGQSNHPETGQVIR